MLLKTILCMFFIGAKASIPDKLLFNLISGYITEENSKFCTLLLCWTDTEKVKLHNHLHSKGNVRTQFLNDEKHILEADFSFYNQVTLIVDFDCPNAESLLHKLDDLKFRFLYNWLIILNDPTIQMTDIKNFISTLNLRLDSRFRIAIPDVKRKNYHIYESFKLGSVSDVQIRWVNVFQQKTLDFRSKSKSFYENRKDMEDVLIRTGNRVNYSSTNEEDYIGTLRAKDRTEFQMFNFQLFLVLKEVHKFKFNTTLSNVWFGNNTSGSDGGLAQLVFEKKIDISTSGGYMKPDRVDVYDFLIPLYKFRSSFVFINPGKPKPGLEILKPFSINTWYAFVLATIAIGFSIYLTYWTEFKFVKSHTKYSFCSSMLITISIISQQGSAIIPLRICGRIIFLTLLIMSMMLYNYYTSSLVSSLLSNVPEPIKTLKELYESDLKVALEPLPYVFTYILQQKDDKYISLINKTKIYENNVPNIMSPIEGIDKVKQGNYAYLTELATAFSCLADADQDISCDLADINFIPYGDLGLFVQKYSQYTELFHITKILSGGIHHRIKEFWLSKRPVCLLSSRVKAVEVTELFLVYLIISGGILISIIILMLEILLNKRSSTNISKN